MRILRLYIQGCGVFKSNLIDFTHNDEPQNLICLAGVNGSGKTTVMELIFSLISSLHPDFPENIERDRDRLKSHILTRTKFAQLDILIENQVLSLVWGKPEQRVKNSDEYIVLNPSIIKKNLNMEFQYVESDENEEFPIEEDKLEENIREFALKNRNKKKAESRQVHIDSESFKNLLERIDSAMRDKTQIKSTSALPLVYFFNTHDRETHYLPELHGNDRDIRWEIAETLRYQLSHKYNPRVDDIRKILLYLYHNKIHRYDPTRLGEFEQLKKWINTHVLMEKSIEHIGYYGNGVILRTKSDMFHPLELLSSGEGSLLIIAMQCFLRASKNAVFMIDEVDQSLHPEFQEKMMMLLTQLQKDTDCQIIVSSHSEIIWRMFDSQGLIDLTSVVMS